LGEIELGIAGKDAAKVASMTGDQKIY